MNKQMVNDERLEYKFKVMGYEKGNEILELDKGIISILEIISSNSSEIDYGKWFCTKRRMIKVTRKILDNHFDLHDVDFINQATVNNIKVLLDMGFWDYCILTDQLKKIIKKVSPYDIPINFSWIPVTNKSFLNDSVFFTSIDIAKGLQKMIVPCYGHEIGHTQLDSQKGVIIDYHNREVVSIFLENFIAYERDSTGILLKNILLERYDDLFHCIEFLKSNSTDYSRKLEASIFIVSTLKAECLFDKYMNSDIKTREEILWGIQKVFDGKQTLEDFLDRYDISMDNSKNKKIFSRQLKKYK